MEVRTAINEYFQECENIHIRLEVVDDKTDEAPYLICIEKNDQKMLSEWLRDTDINALIRMLNKVKRERKRLIGE